MKSLRTSHIETREGDLIDADMLVKCVGFETNMGCENLLGRSHRRILGESGLSVFVEGHFGPDVLTSPSGSGLINALRLTARFMNYLQNDASKIPLKINVKVRINHFDAAEGDKAMKWLAKTDTKVHKVMVEQTEDNALRCNEMYSPTAYVSYNERSWGAVDHMLLRHEASRGCEQLPYPQTLKVRKTLPHTTARAYPFTGKKLLPPTSVYTGALQSR